MAKRRKGDRYTPAMTFLGMSLIELTAVAFGLACVVLTIYQSIWCWPTGLVMVGLYIVIFFEAKLYSDMALQVVYVGLQVYGWHQWLRGGPRESALPVTRLSGRALAGWTAAGLGGAGVLGLVMSRATDASLPYWDALTTSLSLVAQWLMARKRLESWLFWIVVDVVAVGVYVAKDLRPTAGLYAVFLVLATIGLLTWIKSLPTPDRAAATA